MSEVTGKKRVLCYSGGLDSSAILAIHLWHEDLHIDRIIMADPGAEKTSTYAIIQHFKLLCDERSIPFDITSRDIEKIGRIRENITGWVTRNGCIPLMPGSSRKACSKRFKGDVIETWAKRVYPEHDVEFIIGMEANETKRLERFSAPKGGAFTYSYPLMERGMTRQMCVDLLAQHNLTVPKSSCVFCPYMKNDEIAEIINEYPEQWEVVKFVETRFKIESKLKNDAWIAANRPVNAGGTCFAGHWKHNSYERGVRLFSKRVGGKQLSVQEWEDMLKEREAKVA